MSRKPKVTKEFCIDVSDVVKQPLIHREDNETTSKYKGKSSVPFYTISIDKRLIVKCF